MSEKWSTASGNHRIEYIDLISSDDDEEKGLPIPHTNNGLPAYGDDKNLRVGASGRNYMADRSKVASQSSNANNKAYKVKAPLHPAKRRKTEQQMIRPIVQASLPVPRLRLPSRHGIVQPLVQDQNVPNATESQSRLSKRRKITSGASSEGALHEQDIPFKANEQLEYVLRKHVFPHINAALDPYNHFLPKSERSRIGTEVAGRLVIHERGFIDNLKRNNFTLSETLKAKISSNAIFLVNQAIKKYIAEQECSESSSSTTTSTSPPTSIGNDAIDGHIGTKKHSAVVLDEEYGSDNDGDTMEAVPSAFNTRPSRITRSSDPLYARPKRKRRTKAEMALVRDPIQVTPQPQPSRPQRKIEQLSFHRPKIEENLSMANEVLDSHVMETTQNMRELGARKPRPIQRTKDFLTKALAQREIYGNTRRRRHISFKAAVTDHFENSYIRQSEWTGCAGDVVSTTWVNENAFLCGAVTHSDLHNMQYNKPGNLLLGSTTFDALKAYSDHRIARPAVEHKDNGLESMRQTQSPWLYPSVVCTASSRSGLSFTASFDSSVKVWDVAEDGSAMNLSTTWDHPEKVNFVVTSTHHMQVATATALAKDAIRVYNLDPTCPAGSTFYTYCGNRQIWDPEQSWNYLPATIQWGRAHCVRDLLLVGYSPRAEGDGEIPEDRKNTGELCVWNTASRRLMPINASHSQNVFECVWHPTLPIFVAATSPAQHCNPHRTKTQIRVFALRSNASEEEAFIVEKTFDCPAIDINELTIRPNSTRESYVTVSGTDGNTYVYDTAQGDDPIHILQHGEPFDPPHVDADGQPMPREIYDEGVKFAAWGRGDQFYTGSSDGKIKAWNIQAPPGKAFVRNVLEVPTSITSGTFSRDYSKLLIGDASGKVHLLSHNRITTSDENLVSPTQASLSKSSLLPTNIRRPKDINHHPEPAPPDGCEMLNDVLQSLGDEDAEMGGFKSFLKTGILQKHPNPWVGVVKGPNYFESGYFNILAHEESDILKPLNPVDDSRQLYHIQFPELNKLQLPTLPAITGSDKELHKKNLQKDIISRLCLDRETKKALDKERAELLFDGTHSFEYEL